MMATDYIRFLEADFGHAVRDKIKELEQFDRRPDSNSPEAASEKTIEQNRKEMIRKFQEEKAHELRSKQEKMKAEQEQLQNQISDYIDEAGLGKDELATAEVFQATYEKYRNEMEAKFEEMMAALKGEDQDDNDGDGGILTRSRQPNGPTPSHDGPSTNLPPGRANDSNSSTGLSGDQSHG